MPADPVADAGPAEVAERLRLVRRVAVGAVDLAAGARRAGEPVRRVAESRAELEHAAWRRSSGRAAPASRRTCVRRWGSRARGPRPPSPAARARRSGPAGTAGTPRPAGSRCPSARDATRYPGLRWATTAGARIRASSCGPSTRAEDLRGHRSRPRPRPSRRAAVHARACYPTMYRGRLWTMRQYAGMATAEETNARFRYLLEHGPDRPVGRVRPADADGPRLRSPARRGRGRQDRRGDRLDRRHAPAVRRHPARRACRRR